MKNNSFFLILIFAVIVLATIVLSDTGTTTDFTVTSKDGFAVLESSVVDFNLNENIVCTGKPEAHYKECIVPLPILNKTASKVSTTNNQLLFNFPKEAKDIEIQEFVREYYDTNDCIKYSEPKDNKEYPVCLESVFTKNAGYYEYWKKTTDLNLTAQTKKQFRVRFLVPIGTVGKYSLGINITDKNYVIDPTWSTDTNNDWDLGDYNYMYSTNDGNLQITGQLDWNMSKSFPTDYDQNLVLYYTLNGNFGITTPDGNALYAFNKAYGTAPNKCPQYVCDLNKTNGANTFTKGLWDTNAVNFDGSNDYMASVTNNYINLSKGYTANFWVKQTSTTQNAYAGFLVSAGGAVNNWTIQFTNDAPRKLVVYHQAVAVASCANINSTSLGIDWHNIAITFNPDTDVLVFYLDGNVNCTATGVTTNPDTVSFPIILGKERTTVTFNGAIEEVKVYDKVLTQAQIIQDFNAYWSKGQWGNVSGQYATYTSKVMDAGITSKWKKFNWQEANSQSNIDTNVQIRSCNDANCIGETWSTELTTPNTNIDLNELNLLKNQYFQYKIGYYTNKTLNDLNSLARILKTDANYVPIIQEGTTIANWAIDTNILTATAIADGVDTNGITGTLYSIATTVGWGYPAEPVLYTISSYTTYPTAVANSSYFQVTLLPETGKTIDLNGLTFNTARGGASTPRGFGIKTSADNYDSNLLTADVPTQRPTWTPYSVDLSGLMYQNLTTPITFRFYVYTPSTGSSLEFDDINFTGTIRNTGRIQVLYPINNESFTIGNSIDLNLSIKKKDQNVYDDDINIFYDTDKTDGGATSIFTGKVKDLVCSDLGNEIGSLWHFDNDWNDSTINNNDGTPSENLNMDCSAIAQDENTCALLSGCSNSYTPDNCGNYSYSDWDCLYNTPPSANCTYDYDTFTCSGGTWNSWVGCTGFHDGIPVFDDQNKKIGTASGKFDGFSYVNFGENNIIKSDQNKFTLSFWSYATKNIGVDYYVVARLKQDSEYVLLYYTSDGNAGGITTGFRGVDGKQSAFSEDNILNKWALWTMAYTGGAKTSASSYKFYLNGELLTTNDWGANGGATNTNEIACDGGGATCYGGLLDEMIVYNKELNQLDINALYNKGNGKEVIANEPLNCKYSWNSTGASAGNYYITAKITDLNNFSDYNAGNNYFTLTGGSTTSVSFDFNNMYRKADGNITITGQLDYNLSKSYPTDYASDLNWYLTFNRNTTDGNSTHIINKAYGTNTAGKFNQYVADLNKNEGADTNTLGLWDTNAGNFDGTTGSFQANDSIIRGGAVTTCFWIMPKTTGGGGFGRILDNGKFVISMNGSGSLNYSRDGVSTFSQPNDNTILLWKWNHVCVDSNSQGNNVHWYINGKNETAGGSVTTGTPSSPTDTMKIGNKSTKDRGFNGYIEEVKVYNRVLTQAEALADYNGYWSLNQWGSINGHYASFDSNVFDAGTTKSWDSFSWKQYNTIATVDINAQVRSCNDANCIGESWSAEIDSNETTTLSLTNNQYFQYRFNYYTNLTGNDLNNNTKIGDVNITYSAVSSNECDCPANGDWIIAGICTITTSCISTGNLILGTSAIMAIKGTTIVTIPTTKHLIINKGGKIIIEKDGSKIIMRK